MEITSDGTAAGRARRGRARRRHRGLPLLPVLLLGLLVALVWVWLDTDRATLSPAPPGMPVPEEDDVATHYLGDGTPVFVARTDSEIEVFDAEVPGSGLDADGRIRRLAVFCGSSGWFEDLAHGSVFGRDGRWNGGPAPGSLATYPVEIVDSRVQVTGSAQERDRPGRSTTTTRPPPTGPPCTDLPPDEAEDQLLHHQPEDTVPLEEVSAERWAWVEVRYRVAPDAPHRLRLCDPQGCEPGALDIPADGEPDDGPALARRDEHDRLVLRRVPALADG
ncbi:MAG: Rieske (2Fe-2S) protein [Nitriliruptoraceae bacterium]